MRILLLSNSYPPVLGGLQTVAHAVARHLVGRGHQVQVVTNRYPRSLPEYEVIDGVPVHRWLFLTPRWTTLRQGRADLLLASLYCYPSTRRRLVSLARS